MADISFTPEQLQKLLNYAGQRLGTTPEKLKAAFQQGGLSALSQALSPEEAAKAENLIQNKEQAEALLQDPAVQRLLIQLLGQS